MSKKKGKSLLTKVEHETRSRFKKTSQAPDGSPRIKWSTMNKNKKRQRKKKSKNHLQQV